jgi:hypothetical protein
MSVARDRSLSPHMGDSEWPGDLLRYLQRWRTCSFESGVLGRPVRLTANVRQFASRPLGLLTSRPPTGTRNQGSSCPTEAASSRHQNKTRSTNSPMARYPAAFGCTLSSHANSGRSDWLPS